MTALLAPRFLIDENLSPLLVEPAWARGFEATHVNHLGLRTEADWDRLQIVAAQDWVLVTNNAIEFRGRYREIDLHPGIVFLLPSVRLACAQPCSTIGSAASSRATAPLLA